MTTEVVVVDDNTVELVSAQDLKYWDLVQAVRSKYHEGYTTTRAACKAANVGPTTYYQALKSPYVQSMCAAQLAALTEATFEVVQRSWLRVVMNMASLAQDGSNKEAVQAARFIRDVKTDVERELAGAHGTQGESAAASALRSFLGGKPVKLTQTTVTQEISVGNDG